MKRSAWILLLAMVLKADPTLAQWQSTVTLTTSRDRNAWRDDTGEPDLISHAGLFLARDWQSGHWQGRLSYEGDFNHYAETAARTYHWHQLGLAWLRPLAGDNGWFTTGALYAMRRDREEYNVYDYAQWSAYVDLKHRAAAAVLVYAGYQLRYRHYRHLTARSNWEHALYGRLNFSLPTRTTMILTSEIGLKDYAAQEFTSTVSTGSGGNGGKGRGGRGMEGVTGTVQPPAVVQWIPSLRLSQSLGERTGASLYLRRRAHLSGDDRLPSAVKVAVYTEEELYDDPYGYASWDHGAMVTRLLPWGTMLRLGYDDQRKVYLPETETAGEVERRDHRRQAWARLARVFPLGSAGRTLELYGEYLWLRNASNEADYDYDTGVSTVGMAVSF